MNQDQGKPSSEEAAEPENIERVASGERLRNARQVLGLSVTDVATRLKLNEHKIESLERGDVANIAAPVFVAGYLRAYARLLELSEEKVLSDFGVLAETQASLDEVLSEDVMQGASAAGQNAQNFGVISTTVPSELSETVFSRPKSLLMSLLVGLLVVTAVYFVTMKYTTVDDIQAVLGNISKNGQAIIGSAEEETAQENTVVLPAPESEIVNDEPVSAGAAVVAEKVKPAETEMSVVIDENDALRNDTVAEVLPQSELALIINSDSWVEVKDAQDKRLVYRLAKAGMAPTVMGVAPFKVRLGFVQGVEISYNGRPYDLSRFSGRRSARFSIGNAGDHMVSE